MKKTFSLFLAMALMLSCVVLTTANAATVRTEIGSFDVSRFNGIWDEPSSNVIMLITPGNSMAGLYLNKIYAEYDSAAGCYIVKEKVWNHRAMLNEQGANRVVASNGIGIAFNYSPLSDINNTRLREMWRVWQQVKVGDEVRFSDLDLSAKTLGTNPKVNFTAVRDTNAPKGPYSDLTIVALGDSVTAGGGWTEDLGEYLHTDIINCGIGGDTAAGAYFGRFDLLVPQYNPDIVIISYGINDCLSVSTNPTQAAMDLYQSRFRTLYQKATALGAKVVFQTANNIDVEYYENRYNSAGAYDSFGGVQGYLDKWEQSFRDVAAELGVPMIDLYAKWRSDVPAGDMLVDTVHPTGEGYDMNLEVMKKFWDENVSLFVDSFYFEEEAQKAQLGTTVAQIIASFAGATSLRVTNNGVTLSNTAALPTGAVVESLDASGNVVDRLTLSVSGDTNCDGAMTAADYLELVNYLTGNARFMSAQIDAGDMDGNGQVTGGDYLAICMKLQGLD